MPAAAPKTQSIQDLTWFLVRKSNSFLVKQKGLGRVFSREPSNIAQIHSYKFSGIVNDKAVGIEAAPSGKGVVVSTRKTKSASGKIAGTRNISVIKKGGSRRAAGAVANIVGKRGYRSDLLKFAVARASALVKSQRPSGRKAPAARKVRGNRKPVLLENKASE